MKRLEPSHNHMQQVIFLRVLSLISFLSLWNKNLQLNQPRSPGNYGVHFLKWKDLHTFSAELWTAPTFLKDPSKFVSRDIQTRLASNILLSMYSGINARAWANDFMTNAVNLKMNKEMELNIQWFCKVNDGANWLANEYMEDWTKVIGDDKGKSDEPIEEVTRNQLKIAEQSVLVKDRWLGRGYL